MLRKRSRGTAFERAEARLFWPFVLPATLLYLIFFIGPAIASVFISFHKWDGISTMEWVGIGNYTRLVQDEGFQRSFVNTLVLLIGGGRGDRRHRRCLRRAAAAPDEEGFP